MNKIVFATNNKNKLREIRNMVNQEIQILSLSDINCHIELPETQNTIEGNAVQKARYIYDNYGYSCFADDTGLEIDSLDGDPGVYSARYAGDDCSPDKNIKKVLLELDGNYNRDARFRTVISLFFQEKRLLFEGECKGTILKNTRGSGGFGYDPIFMPSGYNITFAEMSMKDKSEISHRGKALRKLMNYLRLI